MRSSDLLVGTVFFVTGSIYSAFMNSTEAMTIPIALAVLCLFSFRHQWASYGRVVVSSYILVCLLASGVAAVGNENTLSAARLLTAGLTSAIILFPGIFEPLLRAVSRKNRVEPGLPESLILWRNHIPDLISESRFAIKLCSQVRKQSLIEKLRSGYLIVVGFIPRTLTAGNDLLTATYTRRFRIHDTERLASISKFTRVLLLTGILYFTISLVRLAFI